MIDPTPDIPNGIATGGIIGATLALGYLVAKTQPLVEAWWANRRKKEDADYKRRKDALDNDQEELDRRIEDARQERGAAIKEVNDCRDALATCRADKGRLEVTVQWRDKEIADLKAEALELKARLDGKSNNGPRAPGG